MLTRAWSKPPTAASIVLASSPPRVPTEAPADAPQSAPELPSLYSKPVSLGALAAYVYFVFISDVLPGPSVLALDPTPWVEALKLSTNFWLILPLVGQGPVLHPGLEAIFNFDLVWAALFAGFLVDGRESRVPFGRFLIGMQFLTAGVYLPYVAARAPARSAVGRDGLSTIERAAESRALPAVLGTLGLGVLAWGVLGRPDFGDLAERTHSLGALLSDDRLGSSFVVDMAVFALWQGALVDDDLARRGLDEADSDAARRLRDVARYVPFFGLVYYLLSRPQLPETVAPQPAGAPSAAVPTAAPTSPPSPTRWAPKAPWGGDDADALAAPVRGYFDAWNRRDIDGALAYCSADVVYEDTVFPGQFEGKEKLRAHLVKCADALPAGLQFVLDDVAASGEQVGTRWHCELTDGTQLPFARGASMYRVRGGVIVEGFDVVEPTVKSGELTLGVLSVASRIGRALGLLGGPAAEDA